MHLSEHEVNRILREGNSAAQTLRGLYTLSKSQHRKVSFSYLCRQSGIPSKGYLAFVMSGKRRLNEKYWQPLCDAFKLNDHQSEVMRLILSADAEPESRSYYDAKKEISRSQLCL